MLDDDNMEQDEFLDDEKPQKTTTVPPSTEEKQKGTISADLIRGHINTIILRTLSERDKYGYEIIDEIEKKSHGQYELKQPTLYSALKRLENQGYIKAYWKTDEISAGGRRKYFTLTESGKQITEKNRAEWEYSRTVIDNLISDKEFDFSNPAPNPVDFKILKQSTSRVPTVKLEEETTEKNKPETSEENRSVVAASYSKTESDASNTQTPVEQIKETHTESPVAESEKEESKSYGNATYTEQENTYRTDSATEQAATSYNNEIAAQQHDLTNQQPQSQAEQFYNTEIHEQPASYFCSDSIEEVYGDQYDKYDQYNQPEPEQQPAARRMPEKLPPDNEQYKKQHENYLKLIDDRYSGNGKQKNESEYGENLDTDKLIYINKPETERDYKNLINEMYSQTIKPQNVPSAPVYDEPMQYEQPAPPPIYEQEPIVPYYMEQQSEESRLAESDGLKIFTSDRQPKPNGKYSKNFNLGEALCKSAAVTFVYMMVIFAVTLIFKSTLDVTYVYPFMIFALACCMFAVCAAIALCGVGKNSAKPVTHGYIGVCAILTVIAILIVCVAAILMNIDFSSAADICRKMVIPSVTLLSIPLFSVMFYIFSK